MTLFTDIFISTVFVFQVLITILLLLAGCTPSPQPSECYIQGEKLQCTVEHEEYAL